MVSDANPAWRERRLSALELLAVDCQTSGSTPAQGRMIEMAWGKVCVEGGSEADVCRDRQSVLIRPPDEEATLPRRVAKMTGITGEMLKGGEPEERVWRAMRDVQSASEAILAHYAQFERRFFEDAAQRFGGLEQTGEEARWICTHRIAKKLLPGLPSRGLRALAGFFGRPVEESNRAGPHVEATAWVWRHLVRELREQAGIETVGDLRDWMSGAGDVDEGRSEIGGTYAMSRDRRLALPDEPGVYRMLDGEEGTLYIGKATSIRDRVNQYFQTRRGLSGRKKELVSQVHDVRCGLEATPLEAAVAESDAIKEAEPPYNEALMSQGRRTVPVGRWPGGVEGPELKGLDTQEIRVTAGQRKVVDGLCALESSLVEGEPTDGLAEALQHDELGTVDELRAAFEGFRERVRAEIGDECFGYHHWMVCGARWRRRNRRRDEEESSDEETSAQDRTYADEFESCARHGTKVLGRAIWLRRLSGAALAWRPRHWEGGDADAWRFVGMSDAQISERGTWPAGEARRRLLDWRGDCGTLQTIEKYDRVRVVATELTRLAGNGAELRVGFRRCWMDGEILRRLVTTWC